MLNNLRARVVVVLLCATILVVGPPADVATAGPPDAADGVRAFDLDVYAYFGASFRNPPADIDPTADLYNVAGIRLDDATGDPVTWGEWSAARATSRVATTGGAAGRRTDVRLEMQGLVPGGLYSVFYFTVEPDSQNPLCPGVERLLPVDAFKADPTAPDPSSFVADLAGTASFHGRTTGDLLAATLLYFNVVYHADGQTYYPLPNRGEFLTQGEQCRSSFGHDAMRHLIIGQKATT